VDGLKSRLQVRVSGEAEEGGREGRVRDVLLHVAGLAERDVEDGRQRVRDRVVLQELRQPLRAAPFGTGRRIPVPADVQPADILRLTSFIEMPPA
jgi:hypothetical protein